MAQLKAAKGLDLLHLPDYTISNYDVVIQFGEADIFEVNCKTAQFNSNLMERLSKLDFVGKKVWIENIVATSKQGRIHTFPNQHLRLKGQ